MAPSQLPEESIDTERREEGSCPVCGLEYAGRQRLTDRAGESIEGRAYIHDAYLCGEWADGRHVEGMERQGFPAQVE
jgi:hypothetical protein